MFALLFSVSCADDTAAKKTEAPAVKTAAAPPVATKKINANLPTLIFFINPGGRPCQIQDQILKDAPDLHKFAQIKYVSTIVPDDREMFYKYGVRSLPSLILVDQKDSTLHRFPPGIHQYDALRPILSKGVE